MSWNTHLLPPRVLLHWSANAGSWKSPAVMSSPVPSSTFLSHGMYEADPVDSTTPSSMPVVLWDTEVVAGVDGGWREGNS